MNLTLCTNRKQTDKEMALRDKSFTSYDLKATLAGDMPQPVPLKSDSD